MVRYWGLGVFFFLWGSGLFASCADLLRLNYYSSRFLELRLKSKATLAEGEVLYFLRVGKRTDSISLKDKDREIRTIYTHTEVLRNFQGVAQELVGLLESTSLTPIQRYEVEEIAAQVMREYAFLERAWGQGRVAGMPGVDQIGGANNEVIQNAQRFLADLKSQLDPAYLESPFLVSIIRSKDDTPFSFEETHVISPPKNNPPFPAKWFQEISARSLRVLDAEGVQIVIATRVSPEDSAKTEFLVRRFSDFAEGPVIQIEGKIQGPIYAESLPFKNGYRVHFRTVDNQALSFEIRFKAKSSTEEVPNHL
jgi:hypothetical protein